MTDRNAPSDTGIYGELGKRVAQGDQWAFELVLKGANACDGYAQLELGFAHAKGFCVKQDNQIAIQWYEKAASQGILNAQFNLGCMHYLGQGCKRSAQNAIYWFEIAADGGHVRAKQNLVPLRMEAELAAEEQALWAVRGINKAAGIVKFDLAHGYLNELKELLTDPEVRDGLSVAATDGRYGLGKANEVNQALTLVYNISSATPLSIDKVLSSAINCDWKDFDSMSA